MANTFRPGSINYSHCERSKASNCTACSSSRDREADEFQRGARGIGGGDVGAVQVGDEAVVVLHVQLQEVQFVGVIDIEFQAAKKAAAAIVHVRFEVGLNQRFEAIAPLKTNGCRPTLPLRVVEVELDPAGLIQAVGRHMHLGRCPDLQKGGSPLSASERGAVTHLQLAGSRDPQFVRAACQSQRPNRFRILASVIRPA